MSAIDAQAAGALFYALPEQLTDGMIDPLLRKAVRRINESGWCWTAESCQGHPDSVDSSPWAGNTRPFLRLVCDAGRAGELLVALLDSLVYDDHGMRQTQIAEIYAWTKPIDGYRQYMVYIEAHNAYERNLGIAAFERFAEALHGQG